MAKSILSNLGLGLLSMGNNFIDGSQNAQKMAMEREQMDLLNQYRREQMADSREARAYTQQRQDKQDYMQSYDKGMEELANDALMKMASGQTANVDPSVLRRIDPTKLLAIQEKAGDQAWKASMGMGAQMPGILSPQSVPQQGQPQAPIWQRNNNPGNMRVPGKSEFQQFPDMQSGLNAIPKQLSIYQSRGINTPRQIASTWAPASDGNNVDVYASILAKQAGVGVDDPLDMTNPQHRMAITKGITQVEGSGKAITDDMLAKAAGMGQPGVAPTAQDQQIMGIAQSGGQQYAQGGRPPMSDASGAPQMQGGMVSEAMKRALKLPPEQFTAFLLGAPKNFQSMLAAMYKEANPEAPTSIREFQAVYGRQPNSPEEYRQFKKGESSGGSAFEGSGMDQQSWSIVNSIGPKIQEGTATPEEQRRYMSAEAHLSTPKVSTDPSTGAQTVMQLDLGQFGFPSLRKQQTQQQAQQSGGAQQPQTGYATTQTTQPKVPEDVRKSLVVVDDMLESIEALRKEMSQGGVIDNKMPFTEHKGRVGSAYTLLQMRLKEAMNLGVLNGPDLVILEKMIQDPTSLTAGWSSDSMKGGLDVVQDMFHKKKQSLVAGNPGSEKFQRSQTSASHGQSSGNKVLQFDAQGNMVQ